MFRFVVREFKTRFSFGELAVVFADLMAAEFISGCLDRVFDLLNCGLDTL